MKAKTILELLNLSSNIYLIAKDKKLIEKISELSDKGKEKLNELKEEYLEDGEEDLFVNKLLSKLQEAKQELEIKIEEGAAKVYHKMNIAHTDQIKNLNEKIDELKKELGLLEARINHIEVAPSKN